MLARVLLFAGCALFMEPGLAQFIRLGPAPEAPRDLPVATGIAQQQTFISGNWIDTSNRTAVVDGFNNAFLPTYIVEMGWTGSIAGCVAGDISAAWRDAVIRRINWFRGMAGVPMSVSLNPTFSAKNQKAALLMSANQQLSHTPPSTWGCYSSEGAEAAGKSNICALSGYGNTDPGCVASYMEDSGSNNQAVGHRRWLLYPQTTQMGTGDVSQTVAFPRANAIWVVDMATYSGPRPATRDEFVAWPPRGYTPYQVMPARWSLSYRGADFSGATVRMTRDGVNIGTTLLPLSTGAGEPTLVWEPATSYGQTSTDVAFAVTVSNVIIGGVSRTFTYTVSMIDPARSTSPLVPVTIQTSPAGLSVTADSTVLNAPVTLNWTSGSQHTIGAVSPIVSGSTRYVFTGWNHGGAQTQVVTIPSGGGTYTANYARQHRLSVTVVPAGAGTVFVSPSSADGYYSEGTLVQVTATPAPGYTFTNWGGDLAGTSASNAVPMSAPRSVSANFSAPAACSYSLSGTASSFPSGGGASTFTVNTRAGCSWTSRSSASWVVLTSPPAQTGTGNISFNVLPNASAAARSASIQIDGGLTFVVTQAGFAGTGTALQFVPLNPCRLVDTRPSGGKSGAFGPPTLTGARDIPVQQSACGVPSNALAYSLNLTVVPPAPLSYVSVWPTGQNQPSVSTLNSWDGRVVANAAIVSAGTAGAIRLFASSATEIIVDINGYFVPAGSVSGLQFYPVAPCRAVDTRAGSGKSGSFGPPSLAGGTTRTFSVPASGCSIPSNAQAFSLNVTAVPSGPLGYVTVWPGGQSAPVASTLNSWDGSVVANAAIVPAGTGGTVSLFTSDTTDLVVDINGYFAAPSSAGFNFFPVTPCRAVDTRQSAGKSGQYGPPILPAGNSRTFDLASAGCGIPPTAQAHSLNITVVPPGPLAYLTTWAAGQPMPLASTLNAWRGQVTANAALVPAGVSSAIGIFVSDTTEVIVDVNGYFGR